MLKNLATLSGPDLEQKAAQRLLELLKPAPFIAISQPAPETASIPDAGFDFTIEVDAENHKWMLVCEVKANGQPRNIRYAALKLKDYVQRARTDSRMYPIVMAPFISQASAEICKELGVGYADLAGNCRLVFGNIYIDRSVAENPFSKRREQKSLFAPKSARILRAMLANPSHPWKVMELADKAGVSVGQVSNVRKMLLDREWGEARHGELRLTNPKTLLTDWREHYKSETTASKRYYTLLHGDALEQAIRTALSEGGPDGHMALASYSAAKWMAPFARITTLYLYADEQGEAMINKHLKLEPAAKGENVQVIRPSDDGVLRDRVEFAPGIWGTSAAQTYLDLFASGERGKEAAEHLLREYIEPRWKASDD